MMDQICSNDIFELLKKNRHILLILSCFLPAIYFITVFLLLRLYVPVAGGGLVVALFLMIYLRPLKEHKFNTVFCGVLILAFLFELFAAFYLEWEMGFQDLLFTLIPLCFSYLYLDNNFDQIIPHGIRYSIAAVLCFLLCDVIDFIVLPSSGATHWEIRIISGVSSILTIGMIFVYVVLFIIELYATHQKLMKKTNEKVDGLRISMMLSQIKPHFIYNTMGAIEEMIDTNPTNAKQALTSFARFMRNNIDSLSSSDLIPFEKEFSHVQAYMQIQNLRFGDAISMEYNIACTNFSLPPLTIQPIVENAIRHGIRPKGGSGVIKLSTNQDANSYIISITDDGVGIDMKKAKAESGSTGLYNIDYRLQKLCNGHMEMISEPCAGTTVTITIPKSEEEKGMNV